MRRTEKERVHQSKKEQEEKRKQNTSRGEREESTNVQTVQSLTNSHVKMKK